MAATLGGFKMTLVKDVQKGKTIYKNYKVNDVEIEGDPNNDNSPLTFTITTDVRDRDMDIVDPAGIQVENFRHNAVMQWAHQYDELPVGKSVEMFATQIKMIKDGSEQIFNAVKARVVFQPDSNYHESYSGLRGSMVRRMYVSGFLNAVSIGFDPWTWEEIEEKIEGRDQSIMSEMMGNGTKFTKWDLLEFSAVPVPANPQALIERGMTGEISNGFKKQLRSWANDALEKCECQLDKPVLKPYPNEHACRLRDPGDFQPNTFARTTRKHEGKEYSIIMGRLKGETTMTEQAYRYPKDTWDAASAKAHCSSHDGASFEAASSASIDGTTTASTNRIFKLNETTGGTQWQYEYEYPPGTIHIGEVNIGDQNEEEVDVKKEIEEIKKALKAGRVLSQKNEADIAAAADHNAKANELLKGVLAQLQGDQPQVPAAPQAPQGAAAPVRTVSYPLGHDAPVIKTEVESTVDNVTEPPVVESDDDIIVIDEDDLLRVINEIPDNEELPYELREADDETESDSSLATQRDDAGDETETELEEV